MKKGYLWIIVGAVIIVIGLAIYFNSTPSGSEVIMNLGLSQSAIKVQPKSLEFSIEQGRQASKPITIKNTGNKSTAFQIYISSEADVKKDQLASQSSVEWLTVNARKGQIQVGQEREILVGVNDEDLKAQEYTAYLYITNNGNDKISTVKVDLGVLSAPKLKLTSIDIADGTTTNTWGNSNQTANSGERVLLTATFKNKGTSNARGVVTSLSGDKEFIQIVDSKKQTIGTVKAIFSVEYLIDIKTLADNVIPPVVSLKVSDSQNRKWLEDFYLGEPGSFDYPIGLERKKSD